MLRLDGPRSGDPCREINVAVLGVGRYGAARADGHRLRRDAIHALNHRNVSRLNEGALKTAVGISRSMVEKRGKL